MAIKVYSSDVLLLQRDKPFHLRDFSSQTEQAGYIDAKTQVTRLLMAGVNLASYRRAYYEFPDGVVPDDVRPDPTLDVGFDPADGDAIVSGLMSKLDDANAVKTDASNRKASNKDEEGTTEDGAEA